MTDFTVSIIDPLQLEGITWAREQYNAGLPPFVSPPLADGEADQEPIPNPLLLETDAEYVQFVMEQAAISYADQKLRVEYQQSYEDTIRSRNEERSDA